MRRTLMGAAMLLALGASLDRAQALTKDQAGSCTLGGGVALAIKLALVAANATQKLGLDPNAISVDSIVIRSTANPNGGQPLKNTNPKAYTGAIVCTFDAGLLPPAKPYIIKTPPTAINDIDLRASLVDTWIQYNRAGKTENLLCLSAAGNNNCFNIVPKP